MSACDKDGVDVEDFEGVELSVGSELVGFFADVFGDGVGWMFGEESVGEWLSYHVLEVCGDFTWPVGEHVFDGCVVDGFGECFEGDAEVEAVVAAEFDADVFDAVVFEGLDEEVACYFGVFEFWAVDVEDEVPSFAEFVEFAGFHAGDDVEGVVPEFFAAVEACAALFDHFENVAGVVEDVGAFAVSCSAVADGDFFVVCFSDDGFLYVWSFVVAQYNADFNFFIVCHTYPL